MSDFLSWAVPGVRALRPYQPGKPMEELEREYGIRESIKLASNENPNGPSPRALHALQTELGRIGLYPDGNGFRLKAKLAERCAVPAAALTLGNGSSEVLEFAVRAFVSVGDEVIVAQHAFAIYPILVQAAGGRCIEVPARDWGHDLVAMRAAVGERTRLIFIANPNNPTGTWLPAAELEAFIASLPQRVMVVVDEAYFEYASDPALGAAEYPNSLEWVARYPNLIVTRTFSKVYGLAGLRVGYAVSHPEVADLMNRIRPPFNVNSLALAAAEAALDDEAHLRASLAMNAEGMQYLGEIFSSLGLPYIPSIGNFVAVEVGDEAAAVYDALLHEGVIVRPVANYGMAHHLRVTVGSPAENQRFVAALKKVLGRA